MADSALWDERSSLHGLHAVLSTRWSEEECRSADLLAATLLTDRVIGGGRKVNRLLDLGCGIGRLTGVLAKNALAAIGVDTSLGMIDRARRENRQANASFMVTSAAALPFAERSFDCVVAAWVLQHITDDADYARACSEIRRVLTVGGRLLLLEGDAGEAVARVASPHTRPRPLDWHCRMLGPNLVSTRLDEVTFVSDAYLLGVWEKRSA